MYKIKPFDVKIIIKIWRNFIFAPIPQNSALGAGNKDSIDKLGLELT